MFDFVSFQHSADLTNHGPMSVDGLTTTSVAHTSSSDPACFSAHEVTKLY